jgi:hypothetical protein
MLAESPIAIPYPPIEQEDASSQFLGHVRQARVPQLLASDQLAGGETRAEPQFADVLPIALPNQGGGNLGDAKTAGSANPIPGPDAPPEPRQRDPDTPHIDPWRNRHTHRHHDKETGASPPLPCPVQNPNDPNCTRWLLGPPPFCLPSTANPRSQKGLNQSGHRGGPWDAEPSTSDCPAPQDRHVPEHVAESNERLAASFLGQFQGGASPPPTRTSAGTRPDKAGNPTRIGPGSHLGMRVLATALRLPPGGPPIRDAPEVATPNSVPPHASPRSCAARASAVPSPHRSRCPVEPPTPGRQDATAAHTPATRSHSPPRKRAEASPRTGCCRSHGHGVNAFSRSSSINASSTIRGSFNAGSNVSTGSNRRITANGMSARHCWRPPTIASAAARNRPGLPRPSSATA